MGWKEESYDAEGTIKLDKERFQRIAEVAELIGEIARKGAEAGVVDGAEFAEMNIYDLVDFIGAGASMRPICRGDVTYCNAPRISDTFSRNPNSRISSRESVAIDMAYLRTYGVTIEKAREHPYSFAEDINVTEYRQSIQDKWDHSDEQHRRLEEAFRDQEPGATEWPTLEDND